MARISGGSTDDDLTSFIYLLNNASEGGNIVLNTTDKEAIMLFTSTDRRKLVDVEELRSWGVALYHSQDKSVSVVEDQVVSRKRLDKSSDLEESNE